MFRRCWLIVLVVSVQTVLVDSVSGQCSVLVDSVSGHCLEVLVDSVSGQCLWTVLVQC